MKISCEIVQDLLPLYVDNICSEASREMVDEHLRECSPCNKALAAMQVKEAHEKVGEKEKVFSDGLKKLKKRNLKRVILAALASALALILVFVVVEALFALPLKNLTPEDVRISAEVFNADELPVLDAENDGASISLRVSGEDGSELVAARGPSEPNVLISMTQSALDEMGACTLIKWESDYHIRRMQWRYSNVDPGIVYLDSMGTSIFNNKANKEVRNTVSIEAGEIHKIIYVGKNGEEIVMWEQGKDVSTDSSRQIAP